VLCGLIIFHEKQKNIMHSAYNQWIMGFLMKMIFIKIILRKMGLFSLFLQKKP